MRLRHMDLGIQLLPERGKGSIALPKTGEVLIPLTGQTALQIRLIIRVGPRTQIHQSFQHQIGRCNVLHRVTCLFHTFRKNFFGFIIACQFSAVK